MKSPKLKLIFALAGMFALGALSGASLGYFCHPHFFGPPGEREVQDHLLNFLTSKLNLTPDEQAKIKPITADFARQIEALHAQSVTQFQKLADATDDQVAAFITPEQKAELDKIRQQRHDDFLKHGVGPPMDVDAPHGPPPPDDVGPAGPPKP